MTVDFCCICPNFSSSIYMLFLLCGNNVQVCTLHVEHCVTWNLHAVDILLFMFKLFPHAATRNFCYVKIMCKYVHFMWIVMPREIWLWICAVYVHAFPHTSTCNSGCMELMCKYAYFMWNFVTHGISLWNFVVYLWITCDNLWHFEKKKGKNMCPNVKHNCSHVKHTGFTCGKHVTFP